MTETVSGCGLCTTSGRPFVRVSLLSFAETTSSTEVSDGLAERLGDQVQVVELHTESPGDAQSDAATYLDMMRANANLIADSLGGSAAG